MKEERVKKADIAGSSNAQEDANTNKEYSANGDVLGRGVKKKKMRFADYMNFTEENIGPNHAKDQLNQLRLNFVEEYDKD
eukprot:2472256-Ditylum_brightwellii.AAC.1